MSSSITPATTRPAHCGFGLYGAARVGLTGPDWTTCCQAECREFLLSTNAMVELCNADDQKLVDHFREPRDLTTFEARFRSGDCRHVDSKIQEEVPDEWSGLSRRKTRVFCSVVHLHRIGHHCSEAAQRDTRTTTQPLKEGFSLILHQDQGPVGMYLVYDLKEAFYEENLLDSGPDVTPKKTCDTLLTG